MEVILLQDVKNLGHTSEVVKVADGYGRNYLIPQGMATLATPSAKKVNAENQRQRAHKEAQIKNKLSDLAEQLKNAKIKIGAKTSSTGKIFGSVNTIQLSEALSKKGFDIDRKSINLPDDHIKEVGTYTAVIKLHREVSVELQFEVFSE